MDELLVWRYNCLGEAEDELLLLLLKEWRLDNALIWAGAVRDVCFWTVSGLAEAVDAAAVVDVPIVDKDGEFAIIARGLGSSLMLLKASKAALIFAWVFSSFLILLSISEPRLSESSESTHLRPEVAAGNVWDLCLRLHSIDSAWWMLWSAERSIRSKESSKLSSCWGLLLVEAAGGCWLFVAFTKAAEVNPPEEDTGEATWIFLA